MRVVLLPGIWPPDVGGPATHGPELARFLGARGHDVHVVTMGDGPPSERPCPVETISRARPFPIRYPQLALVGMRAARRADVVYASATYAAAAAAAYGARRPLVVKLVSDPAYERARRYGLFSGTLEEFQGRAGPAVEALKRARTRVLRTARLLIIPSEYLAAIARGWGLDAGRLVVVPNPAPDGAAPDPEPLEPYTFVFAGRLTRQKALGTAISAIARVPEARLVVIGEGEERAALERHTHEVDLNGRVVFRGARPRAEVLRALAGAHAAILSSDWENSPHAAVEALAVGTPVVATAVGGVPEVVHDGQNGLLVAAGRPDALAAAVARLVEEDGLRERLAAGALESVVRLRAGTVYERLEGLLVAATSFT
jgi:glycosyltransferase involved in cell wall biosynthesis